MSSQGTAFLFEFEDQEDAFNAVHRFSPTHSLEIDIDRFVSHNHEIGYTLDELHEGLSIMRRLENALSSISVFFEQLGNEADVDVNLYLVAAEQAWRPHYGSSYHQILSSKILRHPPPLKALPNLLVDIFQPCSILAGTCFKLLFHLRSAELRDRLYKLVYRMGDFCKSDIEAAVEIASGRQQLLDHLRNLVEHFGLFYPRSRPRMDVLDSLAFLTTLSLLEHVKSRKSKAVVVVGLHPPIGVTWLRYMAPDIYSELSNGESQHTGSYKSLACDIFALNLVILAVFAEMPRIGGFRLAMKTTMAIASGRVTSRPRKTKRQFSDQLWDLMEHCWTFYPKGRPLIEDVLALLTNRPGKSKQVDVNPSVAATRLGVEKLYKTTRAAIGYTLFGTQSFTSLRKLCRALGRYPRKCTINEGLNITNHTPIGAGTFGDVYRGRYDQHDVALKVIRVFRSSDRDDREVKGKRFSMEAMMWHFLQHENLVPFLGVSTTIPLFTNASEPPLCLVSEWMPHGTLCEYTVNHPSASGLKLLSEIADGLSYLHSYSLVHGDLKGANIFINKEHRACIADFGLTRFIYDQMLSENNELATAMEMSGSLRWMSRELLFPNDDSPRVPTLEGDMYAFGMVMWETFTGKIPYPDETDGGLMLRVYLDRRPERPPNSLGLGLTDEVWDLMVRCWHGEVHHRPTASSALQELQTALNCGYSTTRRL